MNVEIGAEAALFPEKEFINGIAIAVCEGSEQGDEYCEEANGKV
jgi:hypothetical protein